jgi:hypothetical protein
MSGRVGRLNKVNVRPLKDAVPLELQAYMKVSNWILKKQDVAWFQLAHVKLGAMAGSCGHGNRCEISGSRSNDYYI